MTSHLLTLPSSCHFAFLKINKHLEAEQFGIASHAIDALLARATVSPAPLIQLAKLSSQILLGMCSLAAHDARAAEWLVHILNEAVAKMNTLALHKPTQFEMAEYLFGIPGIITSFPDQQEQNDKLVKLLKTGERFPIPFPMVGAKGKKRSILKTASNLWAARLYNHICHAQIVGIACDLPGDTGLIPEWVRNALQLKPLSSVTWPDWFSVAWAVVLETTDCHPEREPVLYEIGKAGANKKLSAFSKQEHPGTRGGFVRDEIRKKLRGAFKELSGAK